MHVETTYFFVFENVLVITKNFRNFRKFFQVLLSTIFYKWSGTFSETFSTLSSLVYNIFLKKTVGFCLLINLKFEKVLTSLLASLALSKNKNSKASRLVVGLPPFHCYPCLSVWCVFFVNYRELHRIQRTNK